MKKFILLVITIFAVIQIFAQTHYEDWNKLSIYKSLSNKISTILDVNFRQQANYRANEKNPFQFPLMRSERLWLFYNLNKNCSIVGSLFYANTNDIIDAKADIVSSKETQFNIGVFNKSLVRETVFRSRLLFEKRNINPSNADEINQYRYRFMELVTIPLKTMQHKQSINLVMFDEVFLKTQNSITSFDQNRLAASLQLHCPKVEYNIGVQKTYQNQNDKITERNQLLFNIFLVL